MTGQDVLKWIPVDDMTDLARKIRDGEIAVYAWEWSRPGAGTEEFEAVFDDAALDIGVVVYFRRIKEKSLTIGFNADKPPTLEKAKAAVEALEHHRRLKLSIPLERSIALAHQYIPRLG